MDPDSSSPIVIYRSRSHPNGRLRRGILGVELVKPLGVTMLPVMIGTLVAMLQGFPVLSVIYIGFPIALLLAFFWTWVRLRSDICEVLIFDNKIALRSVFSAAHPIEDLQWKLLIDLHRGVESAVLTVGLEQFTLNMSEWPEWSRLIEQLQSTLYHTLGQGNHD